MLLFSENAAISGAAFARPVRNEILRSLTVEEFERPHLQLVRFKSREMIHREKASSRGVFFIEEGLIARTVQTREDAPFEVALEGRSGVVGLSLALGSSLAMHQTSAIMPGAALRIEKDAFETLAAELPQLRAALLRHTHSLSLQISYLAFCNAKHPVEQRVPRWLSMACERLGGRDLPVTQDAIATLLGVRRPGVTDALQKLLKDGIIASSRGNIRVLDANELAARSCLCCRLTQDSEARFRMPLHSHVLPQKAE